MTLNQAIILGAIQGITEFLPISSDGHLVIAQKLLGFTNPPVFFDVVIHGGTLIAIIIYFAKPLVRLTRKEAGLIAIGTLPVITIGFIANQFLETLYNSLLITGLGLLTTGTILAVASKRLRQNGKKKPSSITTSQALVIGLLQTSAILPGLSRSGSTVSGGLLAGLDRKSAFTFSFLLGIPALVGAVGLQFIKARSEPFSLLPVSIGFITALVVGLCSLRLLELAITKAKLHYFSAYCFVVGLLVIAASLFTR